MGSNPKPETLDSKPRNVFCEPSMNQPPTLALVSWAMMIPLSASSLDSCSLSSLFWGQAQEVKITSSQQTSPKLAATYIHCCVALHSLMYRQASAHSPAQTT